MTYAKKGPPSKTEFTRASFDLRPEFYVIDSKIFFRNTSGPVMGTKLTGALLSVSHITMSWFLIFNDIKMIDYSRSKRILELYDDVIPSDVSVRTLTTLRNAAYKKETNRTS